MSISPALIKDAQAGSQAAMNSLLADLRTHVLRAVQRVLKSRDLAEDCAQDTLLIVSRKLQELDPNRNVIGFARWIAVRRALHLRSERLQTASLDSLQADGGWEPASREASPLQQLSDSEEEYLRSPRVRKVLDRIQAGLSDWALTGFLARRHGLTNRQLADQAGVPEDTARSWKYRCIRGKAA